MSHSRCCFSATSTDTLHFPLPPPNHFLTFSFRSTAAFHKWLRLARLIFSFAHNLQINIFNNLYFITSAEFIFVYRLHSHAGDVL